MNNVPVVFNGRLVPKQFEEFKHNKELYELMGVCFECGCGGWLLMDEGTFCYFCGNTKENSDKMIVEYLKQGGQESAELKKPKRQRLRIF